MPKTVKIMLKNLLINHLITNGKKQTSEKLVLKCFKLSQKQCLKDHSKIFKSAIINCSPVVNIKSIKRGRKQMQEFPFILRPSIRISLAIKLILHTIEKRSDSTFSSKFNAEITQSSKHSSTSSKMKENMHNEAFISRKYANYRWF